MLIMAKSQFNHMQQQAHMLVSKIKEQEVMIQNMQSSVQHCAPQQIIHHDTDPISRTQEPPVAGACDPIPHVQEPPMAGARDPSLVQEPTKAGTKGDR